MGCPASVLKSASIMTHTQLRWWFKLNCLSLL